MKNGKTEASKLKNGHKLILTTNKDGFFRADTMKVSTKIWAVNDIVSTTSGRERVRGAAHDSSRRVEILRRALRNGHNKVLVRCQQGEAIKCVVLEVSGDSDDCQMKVTVARG